MENKNSVLVVEAQEGKLAESLHQLRASLETEKTNYAEVREQLRKSSPWIVVFNLDHQKEEVKEILDIFRHKHPQTYWVLSGESPETTDLIEFMRLGICDFLKQPVEQPDFENFMQRVENWNSRKSPGYHQEHHFLFSFFSCKGGVGQTMAAVNTAVAMSKRNMGRILLVDFVLQHGNVAELLDLDPQYTLYNLMENFDRLDLKLLENSVQRHKSGVYVLPCPKQPEASEFFFAKQTTDMMKFLKRSFNYTLLDAGHEFNAVTIPCLDISDMIFLITTPDLPSLCNTKTALETFKRLGYPDEKIELVLNRWHMKGEIDRSVIEKTLKYTLYHKLADDAGLVLNSINQGQPLHDLSKNAEITKGFDNFVDRLSTLSKAEA